jgi:hypothetical protein
LPNSAQALELCRLDDGKQQIAVFWIEGDEVVNRVSEDLG